MKRTKQALLTLATVTMFFCLILYFALSQAVAQKLKVFKGNDDLTWSKPAFNSAKKTVIIIADNDGTEMFDLMAPFYLFNATQKANVYVVSEKKSPILLVNSLFILPHYSFSEIDSMHIIPDVIVVPNVTIHLKAPPKQSTVNWIKKVYTGNNIILSICDGAATVAATGLFDGKPITTHASDFKTLKKQFPKAGWTKDLSVTESGNLYSTAGVSNAVEGSLTVIKRVFGEKTEQAVLHDVAYPHADVQLEHKSHVVGNRAIVKIASKILFKKNYRIGVLLTDSLNEFELASVLDTYVRSFPKSINSFSINGKKISSKYGLTLYPSADLKENQVNEFHILDQNRVDIQVLNLPGNAKVVNYSGERKLYPIDLCLERIATLYGDNFKNCVKLMLDYN